MDNVNHLLEGASPYQVLSEQSAKLATKWEKSGLLEGMDSSTEKNNMAMLLENQAKQLVNEQSNTGTGTSITTGASAAYATPFAFGDNKRKKKKGYMGYKEI